MIKMKNLALALILCAALMFGAEAKAATITSADGGYSIVQAGQANIITFVISGYSSLASYLGTGSEQITYDEDISWLVDSAVFNMTNVLANVSGSVSLTTLSNGAKYSVVWNVLNGVLTETVTLYNYSSAAIAAMIVTNGSGIVVTSQSINLPAVVPLPAALPLFSMGLLGLAGYRRRRKA